MIFVSALKKQRLLKGLETAIEVYKNRIQNIKTSVLNDIMLPLITNYPPPAIKGKYIKIKYCTQLPGNTPKFVFFANLPQYIKEPYKRYLENQLRTHFNFSGVPIQIFFRNQKVCEEFFKMNIIPLRRSCNEQAVQSILSANRRPSYAGHSWLH